MDALKRGNREINQRNIFQRRKKESNKPQNANKMTDEELKQRLDDWEKHEEEKDKRYHAITLFEDL